MTENCASLCCVLMICGWSVTALWIGLSQILQPERMAVPCNFSSIDYTTYSCESWVVMNHNPESCINDSVQYHVMVDMDVNQSVPICGEWYHTCQCCIGDRCTKEPNGGYLTRDCLPLLELDADIANLSTCYQDEYQRMFLNPKRMNAPLAGIMLFLGGGMMSCMLCITLMGCKECLKKYIARIRIMYHDDRLFELTEY